MHMIGVRGHVLRVARSLMLCGCGNAGMVKWRGCAFSNVLHLRYMTARPSGEEKRLLLVSRNRRSCHGSFPNSENSAYKTCVNVARVAFPELVAQKANVDERS
jgi:hypothetical protein